MDMINGYVFLDLTKSNVYAKALKVLGADKPVVIKDGSGAPYFVDSLTLDGTNVVITKGGKTITINDANAVSSEGSVVNPTMENIKDLSGNLRFIEGDGISAEISGVTTKYCKWSLSGTHIMFVFAFDITNTSVIASGTKIAEFEIPEWLYDKISVVYGTSSITILNALLYAADGATQNVSVRVSKGDDNTITFTTLASLTATADRGCRIQFDSLIDAE